jgi:hypothetical protein
MSPAYSKKRVRQREVDKVCKLMGMPLSFWYSPIMPISAEEIALAKKAYGEMRNYEASRAITWMFLAVLSLYFLLFVSSVAGWISVLSNGKDLTGWAAGLSILSMLGHSSILVILILPLLRFIDFLRLRPRHAENVRLVTELEAKYAGELPYGLERELERVPSKPERPPLLWRLDAFLSRKSTKS